MTSPLDPLPIKQIRLQRDGVKSRCPAHMVDFCHAVEPILLFAVEMLRYVNSDTSLSLITFQRAGGNAIR